MHEKDLTQNLPPEFIEKIPGLRRKYGDLFLFEISGRTLAYRPATVGEFVDYTQLIESDQVMAEDYLLDKVILYPEEFKDLLNDADAGEVTCLVEAVVQTSNLSTFDDFQSALAVYRERAQTAEGVMTAWICAAFPGVTPEHVQNMTQPIMLWHLALAEVVLQRPVEFEDPEKKKKQKTGRKRGLGMMAPPMNMASQDVDMRPSAPYIDPRTPQRASEMMVIDPDAENRAMGMT